MSSKKKAIITGITGQDGSYLAELLLSKGYLVYGILRRTSFVNTNRIDHLYSEKLSIKKRSSFKLIYGDLIEPSSIEEIINKVKPDEIYNLAAQSHVAVSFKIPLYTSDINFGGVVKLLEIIKKFKDRTGKKIKFYQASTSEMFGNMKAPQSEKTHFSAESPYAVSKLAAHNMCNNYRDAYDLSIYCGILFNHESPRRDERFVTRKITLSAARIKFGLQKKLYLGNLFAKRDWGYAPEYVEMMWRMLNKAKPCDLVVATGKSYSVEYFAKQAFDFFDLDYKKYIETNQEYFRPTDVNFLMGNAKKAAKLIKWTPKVNLLKLVNIMCDHDFNLIKSTNKF